MFGMLGAKPGERILDLGCGDGALTAEIKASGADVLGVDLSDELLAVARMKGLNVRKVDGHALDFVSEFDAVFSNAALHWMRKPHLVIAGVHRALRAARPLRRRAWRPRQCRGHRHGDARGRRARATAIPALVAPWFFPDGRGIWPRCSPKAASRARDRARAAADTAQDRHGRLAQDLRQVLLRSVPGAGADARWWARSPSCCGPRCATARACGPPTISGFVSLPSAALDESRHTNAQFMAEAFAGSRSAPERSRGGPFTRCAA